MKFRVSVIDFIPFNGKIPAKTKVGGNAIDSNGTPLFVGDTVTTPSGEDYILMYRYGNYLLKQIGVGHSIGLDLSTVTKKAQITAGNDWLIIGYKDEANDSEMLEQLEALDNLELSS